MSSSSCRPPRCPRSSRNRNEPYADRVFAGLPWGIVIGLDAEHAISGTLERVTVRRPGRQRGG